MSSTDAVNTTPVVEKVEETPVATEQVETYVIAPVAVAEETPVATEQVETYVIAPVAVAEAEVEVEVEAEAKAEAEPYVPFSHIKEEEVVYVFPEDNFALATAVSVKAADATRFTTFYAVADEETLSTYAAKPTSEDAKATALLKKADVTSAEVRRVAKAWSCGLFGTSTLYVTVKGEEEKTTVVEFRGRTDALNKVLSWTGVSAAPVQKEIVEQVEEAVEEAVEAVKDAVADKKESEAVAAEEPSKEVEVEAKESEAVVAEEPAKEAEAAVEAVAEEPAKDVEAEAVKPVETEAAAEVDAATATQVA